MIILWSIKIKNGIGTAMVTLIMQKINIYKTSEIICFRRFILLVFLDKYFGGFLPFGSPQYPKGVILEGCPQSLFCLSHPDLQNEL
jgi:hypothetical protein